MTVLVTAASKHGATAEIADAISSGLRNLGYAAECIPPEQVQDLARYEAVVLGSAIYAGHWSASATTFVDTHAAQLRACPVWLFSSGPVGDPPKPAQDSADVERIMHATTAREHRVFVGKLDRAGLSFIEKVVVKAVHAADGDFRDWDAIYDWTVDIAHGLSERLASAP
jgi:menaquinone-dependent protoporphyrinogen oxidase